MSNAVHNDEPFDSVTAETDFTPTQPDPTNGTNPAVGSIDADANTTAIEPLSKKAQKKLAKAAYIAERKKERRAAEKERKKEKRREYAQKRDAGELDPDELERERERKRQKTEGGLGGRRATFGARVVVDLGFDAKMSENVSVPFSVWVLVVVWGCTDQRLKGGWGTAGGQEPYVAACVYVQREQEGGASVLVAPFHVVGWEDEGADGWDEQLCVQAVGWRGVVGGRL